MMRVQEATQRTCCVACTSPDTIEPGSLYLDLGPDPSADQSDTEPAALCMAHGMEAVGAMFVHSQLLQVQQPSEDLRAAARVHTMLESSALPEVVAYRKPREPSVLLCREHGRGRPDLTPVTAEELTDGGVCTWVHGYQTCGVDVLIGGPQ